MGSTEGATSRLVIDRKSDRDIKMRDLYVKVDDLPEENVKFGETLEIQVAPGSHEVKVTNRLYSDRSEFAVREGETVRFDAINIPKSGAMNLIAIVSGSVMYRPILERR